MLALVSLLFIIAVSILIVRIASTALVLTGLAEEVARFQARSALSGTGFTTSEAEHVINHPVRRRIIAGLIILQNAGLVTAVSALILSFVDAESSSEILRRLALLGGGIAILLYLAGSQWVSRKLSRIIEWALRRYTHLDIKDYYTLLHLEADYTVMRLKVTEDMWLANKTLRELALPEEGVLVLGINRTDGSYVGAPRGRYRINEGEVLVLYGKEEGLEELQQRMAGPAGESRRAAARREHEEEMEQQDDQERSYQQRQAVSQATS